MTKQLSNKKSNFSGWDWKIMKYPPFKSPPLPNIDNIDFTLF
ncbi:MAG: hypothetical protein MRERV_30c018 [Mycoplasmataceae bacterium RV_VA103A]|nr:MAG: hypothetical protein MRERV_30c018 [Mycoplasmataceae bacterium RV_VA103A]